MTRRLAVISTMSGSAWGGSEQVWTDVAHAALERGDALVFSVYRWSEPRPALDELVARGARRFDRRQRSGMRGRLVVRNEPGLERMWRSKPDIVLVSQGGVFDAAEPGSPCSAVRKSGLPYVVLVHSDDALGVTEAHRRIVTDFFEGAASVLFVASSTMEAARRMLAAPVRNAVTLPAHVERTDGVAWPNSQQLELLCAARLDVRTKGQDLLLGALSAGEWRNRAWRLTLAGAGPDEDYLRRLTRLYGLDKNVIFGGHRPRESLWSDCHLVVSPSRVEALPLSLLEAMAAARPCLVTDVGDCATWVHEGRTGWVADAPSVRAITAALERAWSAVPQLNAMGEDARASALARSGPPLADSVLHHLDAAIG